MVVRYQGGNNAGHSVMFDGKKFSLQSIPSGIFNPKTVNVMANGMVINPVSLIDELDRLHSQGVTDYQLYISDRAAMVMPWHADLDGAAEALKGNTKIGTTGKGIGPAYCDKYSRSGLRMGDLLEPEYFAERLREAVIIKNLELEAYGLKPYKFDEVYDRYMAIAEQIGFRICDTSELINDALRQKDEKILFEGAQGMMLCIDHGTYPYVTSSTPSAASVPVGAGISPKWVENVVGVAKAYCTRVGEGPFPTEIFGEVADSIRERGHEYGTVTGRPRRIGWYDAVVGRYTARLAGIDYWAIMLLDVLSGLDKLYVCTAYECDGKLLKSPPSTISRLAKCKPVLEELPGWQEDITGIRDFDKLPENAKNYVKRIGELTGVPAGMISVGPDRSQTIVMAEALRNF